MRLSSALREFQVAGMKTNTIFLYSLANNQTFRDGDFDTSFIAKHQKELFRKAELDTSIHLPLIALYLILHQEKSASQSAASSLEPNSPWNYSNAWRLNETLAQEFKLEIQQKEYTAEVEQRKRREQLIYKISFNGVVAEAFGELDGELLRANLNGHQHRVYVSGDENSYSLFVDDLHVDFKVSQPDLGLDEEAALGHGLAAPMNGTVVALLVGPGEKVKKDDALLVMEAMKMEHTIRAPCDGKVLEFFYQAKDLIDGGSEILSFEEN
jgi:3-methylcrotonyl-CoA carboxylase alpha subunit